MENKSTLYFFIKLLSEETKKIKKKKKSSPSVSAPIIRRPLGSIFYMDAGVSINESFNLAGGMQNAMKPITKKFDHLKWKLNDFQKQFLDDFINIPESVVKDDDLIYASRRTGIPVESIKSIRNTYGASEFVYTKEDVAKDSIFGVGNKNPTAKEMNINGKDLPKDLSGRLFPLNQNPGFRNKSLQQIDYEKNMSAEVGGNLSRKYERELPDFMYEWLLYFIEGNEKFKILESKLMNDVHAISTGKHKFILFSLDLKIKESNAHAFDLASHNELSELKEFCEKVEEFNKTFGTNFVISNQFTSEDKKIKVVLENAQLTDGKKIFNRKSVDMSMTDEKRQVMYDLQKSIYG